MRWTVEKGVFTWADPKKIALSLKQSADSSITTAWEIGKEDGRFPLCVKWLFALQVVEMFFIVLIVIGSAMQ